MSLRTYAAAALALLSSACIDTPAAQTKGARARIDGEEEPARPGLDRICDHSRQLASEDHLAIPDHRWPEMRMQCIETLKEERAKWKGEQTWDEYVDCLLAAESLKASEACDRRTPEDRGQHVAKTAAEVGPADVAHLHAVCEHAFDVAAKERVGRGKDPLTAERLQTLVAACTTDLAKRRKSLSPAEFTEHLKCIEDADTAETIAACGKAGRDRVHEVEAARDASAVDDVTGAAKLHPSAPSNVCQHNLVIMGEALGDQFSEEKRAEALAKCTAEMTGLEAAAGADRWRQLATCYLAAKEVSDVQNCGAKKGALRKELGLPAKP